MGTETPNFNLYKPDKGEDGWASEVNGNFDTIDNNLTTSEEVEDIVGALVNGGTNITAAYDDVNDTLTIDTSALDEEEVEDAVANLITAGNATTVSYDDPNDTLTIAVDESQITHNNLSGINSDDHHTRYTDSEAIAAAAVDTSDGGTQVVANVSDINFAANLTVTDDGDNTVTVDADSGSATTEIDLLEIPAGNSLPDPGTITKPTIAYYTDEDDYVGVFQA